MPPQPELKFSNLKIDIPRTGSISIDTVDIYAQLIPLLRGQFEASSVTLDHPALHLNLPGAAAKSRKPSSRKSEPAGRSFGDILVVAVNSDASVSTIKGEKRPINSQQERAEALAALESVDFVTIFTEPDPYKVISALQPDVLVKGGDWPIEKIIGRDVVEARGGKVVNVPFVEGQSTTGIIDKILQKYAKMGS